MAWERRRNGRVYFYRSSRDRATGRVRKEYLGNGPRAKEAGRRVAERTARRREEQEQRRQDLALSDQVGGSWPRPRP